VYAAGPGAEARITLGFTDVMAGVPPPQPAAAGRPPSSRQTTLFGTSVPSVAAKTKAPPAAKSKTPPPAATKVKSPFLPPTKAPATEPTKPSGEGKQAAVSKPAGKKSVVKDDGSETESVPARKRPRKAVESASSESATPVRPAVRSSVSPPDAPHPVAFKGLPGTQASPFSVSSESPQQLAKPVHPFFLSQNQRATQAPPKKRGRPPKQDAPVTKEAAGKEGGAELKTGKGEKEERTTKATKEAKEAKVTKETKAAKDAKEAKDAKKGVKDERAGKDAKKGTKEGGEKKAQKGRAAKEEEVPGKRSRSSTAEVPAKRQRQPSAEVLSDGDPKEAPVDTAALLVQPAEPARGRRGGGKCHPLFDSARQAQAQAQAQVAPPPPVTQAVVDTSFAALRQVALFRPAVGGKARVVGRGAVAVPPVENFADEFRPGASFGSCSALSAVLPDSVEAGTQVIIPPSPPPHEHPAPAPEGPPVRFPVSDAVRAVDAHVHSSGCVELLLGRAAEAAAAVLPPEQRCPLGAAGAMLPGSERRSALQAHLRRLYASCVLKRVGVKAADYAAARSADVEVQAPAQSGLWVKVYAPSCSLEVSVPASLIATPQPRVVRQLRAFLLEWRGKLLHSTQCQDAPSVAAIAAAGAIASKLIAARLPAIHLLSRLFRAYHARRFLRHAPVKKRTRKKRMDAEFPLLEGFRPRRRGGRRTGFFTTDMSDSTDEEEVTHHRLRGRKALQQRLREKRNNDGSSDGGEGSDVGSEFAFMARALVIRGGAGVGVTASVLACAQEAGFEVREIEPSRKRSRDSVLQSFREATQSRSITARGAPTKPAAEVLPDPLGVKRGRTSTVRRGSRQAAVRAATAACLVAAARAVTAPRGVVAGRRGEHVMLLFESADVVFGDEKGFHAALRSLVDESRCPIVITCNRLTKELEQLCADGDAACVTAQPLPQSDSPDVLPPCHDKVEGEWPGTQLLTPQAGAPVLSLGTALHLGTVLLSEGILLDAVSLAALVSTFGHDLRRALNTLQFWLCASRTQARTPLDVLGISTAPTAPQHDLFSGALFGLRSSHREELAGFLVKGSGSVCRSLAGSTPLTNAPFNRLRLAEANYLRLFDSSKMKAQPNPVSRRALQVHSFYGARCPSSSGRSFPVNTFTLTPATTFDHGDGDVVKCGDQWMVRRLEGRVELHMGGEDVGVVRALQYANSSLLVTLDGHAVPTTLPLPPDAEALLAGLAGLCAGFAAVEGFPQSVPVQESPAQEEELDFGHSQESLQLFAPDPASQQLAVPRCLSSTDEGPLLGQRPEASVAPTSDCRTSNLDGTATGDWLRCIRAGYSDVTASLLDPVRAAAVDSCRTFTRLSSLLDCWETGRERSRGLQFVEEAALFNGEDEAPEDDAMNGTWWRGEALSAQRVYNTCSSLALRAVVRTPAGRDAAEVLACTADPVLAAPLHAYCAQANNAVFCVPVDGPPGLERVHAVCETLLSPRRRPRRQNAAEMRFTSSVHRWATAPVVSRNEWCRTAAELWSQVRSQEGDNEDSVRVRLRTTMLQYSRDSVDVWDTAAAAAGHSVGAVPMP